MKLKKVAIGENRYVHKFELANGSIVEVMALKTSYDNLATIQPTQAQATWKCSSIRIGFDTTSGNLSDGEYATQENGSHWVKIEGYDMVKISPEYIVRNNLSDEGLAKITE